MSPRVISWYFVRTDRTSSSSVGAGRISPRDSCHRCTQRETSGGSPRLDVVSMAGIQGRELSPGTHQCQISRRLRAGTKQVRRRTSSQQARPNHSYRSCHPAHYLVNCQCLCCVESGRATTVVLRATIKGHPQSSFAHAVLQLGKLQPDQHESLANLEAHRSTFMCAFVMAMVGRISTAPRQIVSCQDGVGATYRPPLRLGP